MWEGRGERGANFEQRVDLELARMAVYPKVEADIRTQVRGRRSHTPGGQSSWAGVRYTYIDYE